MEPFELVIDDSSWRIERRSAGEEFRIERHTKGKGWSVVANSVSLNDDESLTHDNSLDEEVVQSIERCVKALMEYESFLYGCLPQDTESAAVDALELIGRYGGIDGGHHKQWVLDQVVRRLTGENYEAWIKEQCGGEDGPDTYEWEEGWPSVSLIHESFIGTPERPRYLTVLETPTGMNMREEWFGRRIRANELSYALIVEIAESTIPFRNVHNLMHNIVIRHKWTTKNCNLRSVCQMVMKACEQVMKPELAPATAGNMFPIIRRHPRADEDVLLEPIVESEAKECDLEGRGVKRYPHTYECILRPHMVKIYEEQDTYAKQQEWKDRVSRDGSPRGMKRRVEAAEKELPF